MQRRGKWIVLGIALLAIALAGGNVVYQLWLGGPAMDYFGAPAARLIVDAPQVEALRLGPDQTGADTLQAGAQRFAILESVDASHANGLLHIRRALITGRLYDWKAQPPEDPSWHYALRFRDDDNHAAILLFTADGRTLARAGSHPLIIRPNEDGVSPLQAFLEEQFARP